MAKPLNIAMPDSTDIGSGYVLQVTALDPTTGNTVSGVNVTSVVIEATSITDVAENLALGNWFLVPGPGA